MGLPRPRSDCGACWEVRGVVTLQEGYVRYQQLLKLLPDRSGEFAPLFSRCFSQKMERATLFLRLV